MHSLSLADDRLKKLHLPGLRSELLSLTDPYLLPTLGKGGEIMVVSVTSHLNHVSGMGLMRDQLSRLANFDPTSTRQAKLSALTDPSGCSSPWLAVIRVFHFLSPG